MKIEYSILKSLIYNSEYTRKVLPFIKEDYFHDKKEKVIFNEIHNFITKYNNNPSYEALLIQIAEKSLPEDVYNETVEILEILNSTKHESYDENWLLDKTETFCQDQAIYNGVVESISILDGKNKILDKGAIPKLLEDALSVSFNHNIGVDYLEDFEDRFNSYHTKEDKIPFDLEYFNKITNGGLPKGTLSLFVAGTNVGKELPNTTVIYTPKGKRLFGDLEVGDQIYGKNGTPTSITAIYPQGIKPVYEISFTDGRQAETGLEHLWNIITPEGEKTVEFADILEKYNLGLTISIPLCDPVGFDKKELSSDPYEFGKSVTINTKQIPDDFLFSSIDDRFELIKGLLESNSLLQFVNKSLVDSILFLVRSLGGIASYKYQSEVYEIELMFDYLDLEIDSIRRVEDKECRCITVDASDSLYLVEDFVVTHNTLVKTHLASHYLNVGKNVLYITLEMSELEISKRVDANLLHVPMNQLENLSLEDYSKKIKKLKERTVGKLIVKQFPTSGANPLHFQHLINELRLKKNFSPDILIIDYLNICASSRVKMSSSINSYTFIKSIAEELRGLAITCNVPIISSTQFARAGNNNSDPNIEDISESFGTAMTADLLLGIIRTEELDNLNQILFKQIKNRFNDLNLNKRFVVGINRSMMKLYDTEVSSQLDIVDSGQNVFEHRTDKGDKSKFSSFKFS